jgi:hypothetical protein
MMRAVRPPSGVGPIGSPSGRRYRGLVALDARPAAAEMMMMWRPPATFGPREPRQWAWEQPSASCPVVGAKIGLQREVLGITAEG